MGSRFAIKTWDSSVEYWDLKTTSPTREVNPKQLIKKDALQQIRQQAPMQLIYGPSDSKSFSCLPVKKLGVFGIGLDPTKHIITRHETIEPPNVSPYNVFNRPTNTVRAVQWIQGSSNPQRVELATEVLREAVNKLVATLMESKEWDAILQALNKHWNCKYGKLSRMFF
ncbi:hypothetical protein [Gloeothece verrucosa]|uniref:Uncharacterized protein n=1 Tax=Gloeothece verrucosa (strain PCC 7822) TaxID=497965 RepID=E0UDY3_GLOV7|nr:hypothetical protein [Gloeothece verrucosa]ADN12987.1 hypothetical protein Cyan7822_0976 [Gloeothece verrucosa PCC 7822]